MSHRAKVALQTGPDSYNIHYSANGAQDLYLTSVLEDHLAESTTELSELSDVEATQVPQLQKWNQLSDIDSDSTIEVHNADRPPIETEPDAVDVPLEHIGIPVDYADTEAFYLVRNGKVETYIPVWLEPNVVRPWRENLEVEVYRSGKLSPDPHEMMNDLQETDPLRVIDNSTLSDSDWVTDTITFDVVKRYHQAVYALQRRTVQQDVDNSKMQSVDERQGVLTLGSYVLIITSCSSDPITPDPQGRGLLIQIPNNNTSRQSNIRTTAEEARVELGVRLNTPHEQPSTDDMSEERKELVTTLLKEYHTDVAPFSPPPFGPLAKSVSEALAEYRR